MTIDTAMARTARRRLRTVCSLFWCGLPSVLCLCCPGCGLVFIPHVERFPSRALERITVLGAESRAPVTTADVTFYLKPWENWLEPWRGWGLGDPGLDFFCDIAECPYGCSTWSASHVGDGVYVLPRQSRWVFDQIWCPLPPVLGCAIHHTYKGTVIVTAAGYESVWVWNKIEREAHRLSEACHTPKRKPPERTCIEISNGSVTVLLPRAPAPRQPP